jgi:hypothetical protein
MSCRVETTNHLYRVEVLVVSLAVFGLCYKWRVDLPLTFSTTSHVITLDKHAVPSTSYPSRGQEIRDASRNILH